MFRLKCAYQTYEWGKIGDASVVYRLIKQDMVNNLDRTKPYAELWMGTHPSGPSVLMDHPDITLENFLFKHPDLVAMDYSAETNPPLQFLFKVLSVNKALSIQAHPTKEHARKLHAQHPDLYKDSNHKPEMAIALTPFEALMSFRPIAEIAAFIQNIPELLAIIGLEHSNTLQSVCLYDQTGQKDLVSKSIKAAYSILMQADSKLVSNSIEQLKFRLLNGDSITIPSTLCGHIDVNRIKEVFIRLATDFPGDCGCFSLFFFNYIRLNPGEAVFLEANAPHAYLSGDCVECMACSDNVVRAGLTPKFKDVDCLLEMLQYLPRTPDSLKFVGTCRTICPLSSCSLPAELLPSMITFSPPVEDFAVDKILIPSDCGSIQLVSIPVASILIVISGQGKLQQLASPRQEEWTNQLEQICPQSAELDADHYDANRKNGGSIGGYISNFLDFDCGSVFFIAAGLSICICPVSNDKSNVHSQPLCFLGFRAYTNVYFSN